MKIGIYSPYLHILGGGERYLLSIAEILSKEYQVSIFSSPQVKEKAKSVLGLSLDRVDFLTADSFKKKNIIGKYLLLKNFDLFFYMTDGSLFFPSAKKNFLIIQSPLHLPFPSVLNRLKLFSWSVICYSQFIGGIIEKRLQKKATVLPPCIDTGKFKSDFSSKENIILTVGRFFPYPHNKKHDFLIDVFQKNHQKYFKDMKFIIAGGLTEEGGREVLNNLQEKIGRMPVEIIVNPSFNQLVNLYKRAKIYWHAAGFGENLEKYPERGEHFGITTLEAMAAGAVPVVFAGGGQKEIIEDKKCGYLWLKAEDLISKTSLLIKRPELLSRLSEQAILKASFYNCQDFYEKLDKIINH